MSIALDIGSSHMRSLRRQRFRLIGRSCRSLFTELADRESHREILNRLGVPHLEINGQLIVPGDSADGIAEFFRVPTTQAILNDRAVKSSDVGREVIVELVNALLPTPGHANEICCFTAGGIPGDTDGSRNEVNQLVAQTIRRCGYQPLGIGGATAVALAELGDQALTGVGITIGAAHCETTLMCHGVELARSSVARGGNWIDEQLAERQALHFWDQSGNRHLDFRSARDWKESNVGSILSPTSVEESQLAALYRELVDDVLAAVRDAFTNAPHAFDALQPVGVVCAGGTASRPGFREIMLDELRKNPFPFGISPVQIIGAWEYSVARGCLIRATLEEETISRRAA
ncbi:MAG: hypothetical protein HOL01_18840 [Planctomycetaceae bacterium]|jgi:hypothetical protein|nr:hypothetical protein [Planctomycetaceae bacterium]MBT6487757.1 hypothetical protein [Planctomycetaceae bacterium]MBT6496596.1 hypothetical protein [Planctomycetaceae bacterium]